MDPSLTVTGGGHDLYSGLQCSEFMHRYDFMKARVFARALPE